RAGRAAGLIIVMAPGYTFDNADVHAPARFAAIAAMFDAITIRHLKRRGIDDGWRCLEIGAGGGSIANWMSMRVGERGHVLATDIDTRYLTPLRFHLINLDVIEHDVTTDSLPTQYFDLVHARLVIMHLRDKRAVLQRLIGALKPGGWLLVEDFD